MTLMKCLQAALFVLTGTSVSVAQNKSLTSVEEYNSRLPSWGVSWTPGARAINGYYQTFYTGFAMRSEFPDRIHVRTARGNQTRVSVILDEQTVSDYLFDLVTRDDFYHRMTSGADARLNPEPSGSSFLPQLDYFHGIVNSPRYGIRAFVSEARQGGKSSEEIYRKGLETLRALNPGRVFLLRFDLRKEFLQWREDMREAMNGNVKDVTGSPVAVVSAINTLLFGRVNFSGKPSDKVMEKLTTALERALRGSDDDFVSAAADLFREVTGRKYSFRVLGANGQWENALKCQASSCVLTYPEFTAIYPTGSAMATTSDRFGNRINLFATPGLWQFLSRGSRHDVDNIRNEPYYGWAPKMDFEGIGNGFHNPAVRFHGVSSAVKKALGIQKDHNTLWAVKRGGVSHGCLRLPLGHVWELRQIFPVSNEKMTKVMFFGNHSQDFDVYDIDGDGRLEVMGVEYLISYGLQGTGGLARREGTDLQINADQKLAFYKNLYGSKNVFRHEGGDRFTFMNPRVSFPSHLDYKKKSVSSRLDLAGDFPLYEQAYEQDKVQFYSIGAMNPANKLTVRLMGRVKGCAPSSDAESCGRAAFEREAKGLLR